VLSGESIDFGTVDGGLLLGISLPLGSEEFNSSLPFLVVGFEGKVELSGESQGHSGQFVRKFETVSTCL